MQEVALSLLIFLAGLPALEANDPEDKDSPFYYGARYLPVEWREVGLGRTQAGIDASSGFLLDWQRLRIGGLICAAVLCTIGIIVLMSGKCKCKFSQKPSHHPGDAPPLITPGSAQNC
uniref:FXYD domain-containing ion transport regulator n=2 Tax=Canis lupus familiaris TaxID=9615 RepID=A0A8C0Q175_CANLF